MFTIQELYNYSSRVRRKFVRRLAKLSNETLSDDKEASFHSMKNILVHMIYVEDWLVNSAILGKKGEYREPKFESFSNMRMVIAYLAEVESSTEAYLKRATEDELRKNLKLRFSSRQKRAFDLTPEECILQSITEQLYHIGELIALLWQQNLEPPSMQWFLNNPRSQ